MDNITELKTNGLVSCLTCLTYLTCLTTALAKRTGAKQSMTALKLSGSNHINVTQATFGTTHKRQLLIRTLVSQNIQ